MEWARSKDNVGRWRKQIGVMTETDEKKWEGERLDEKREMSKIEGRKKINGTRVSCDKEREKKNSSKSILTLEMWDQAADHVVT